MRLWAFCLTYFWWACDFGTVSKPERVPGIWVEDITVERIEQLEKESLGFWQGNVVFVEMNGKILLLCVHKALVDVKNVTII